jgi:hypothetical protein
VKYRKKPVVIEAVQFTQADEFAPAHIMGAPFYPVAVEDRGDDPDVIAEVYDKLHSTWVGVKLNQWIIKGVQGEFYPCDPDVFEATYEAVSE